MGTFNNNLLPTATGLDLGSSGQRWDVVAEDVDIAGTLSTTGAVTLGSVSVTGAATIGSDATVGGNLHVKNEISPTYPAPQAPTTYPLGNDVTLITRGPADSCAFNYALEVTCSANVSPGTATVTVASPTLNGVAQAGNPTALFGDPIADPNLRVIVEPSVPGGTNWESLAYTIVSGTQLQMTFAKSHTGPFKIRQQGAQLVKGFETVFLPDPTGQWTDYSFMDASFNPGLMFNLVSGASWPQSAVLKIPATYTGYNGTNKDLVSRNNTSSSSLIHLNAANTFQLFKIDDNGVITLNGAANGINLENSGSIIGAWSNSSGQAVLTSNVFRPGPQGSNWSDSGYIRMVSGGDITARNNANSGNVNLIKSDTSDRAVVGDSAGVIVSGLIEADAGIKVASGGTTVTQIKVYAPSITPGSVAPATVAEQTFTVSGLTTADKVIVNPPAMATSTGISGARVSAADTLAIRFVNPTAGALTPDAGTYTVVAIRS